MTERERKQAEKCIAVLIDAYNKLEGFACCGNPYAQHEAELIRARSNKLCCMLEADEDKNGKE